MVMVGQNVWVGMMGMMLGGMVEVFGISGVKVAGPGPRLTAVG